MFAELSDAKFDTTSLRSSSRPTVGLRSRIGSSAALALLLAVAWATSDAFAQDLGFQFRDVTREANVLPAVGGIMGHGAGWGDVDGDGWADLCVGTFHYPDTQPNLLLRNQQGKFVLDSRPAVRISTRATGVLFVDLDNDGDLELYVAGMPAPADSRLARRAGRVLVGCSMFRNDGDGRFQNVSAGNAACPKAFGGRSVAALDYDGDGLLDLLVGEDPIPGYNGSKTRRSRLFRNQGDLQFEDATERAGLPEAAAGLGVAAADVDLDGWPDVFLASTLGNYLLLNDRQGGFREAPGSRAVFAWPTAKGDDMVCGVCIADVNGDGLPDVLLGQHYSQPWVEPVANRLYLNRGVRGGGPRFEDVTERVGLDPLPLKGPHVEIQDFDNDGLPDVYTSIVKFANGRPHPLIFRNLGVRDGLPRFRQDALRVNDFPTSEDRATKRSGTFFEKMIAERKIVYAAAAPSCDFDRDGGLDLFLANWWTELPSMLLRNETARGRWLQVRVVGGDQVNRMGVGSRVCVYIAGRAGEADALLGCREIAKGFGYASTHEAVAHFGLGDHERVDVTVSLPHGRGELMRRDVASNQRLEIAASTRD